MKSEFWEAALKEDWHDAQEAALQAYMDAVEAIQWFKKCQKYVEENEQEYFEYVGRNAERSVGVLPSTQT